MDENSTFNNSSVIKLSWYDHLIFTSMLASSALIGIYFGCFGSKQATVGEYLMGGKKMKILPIALSVAVSQFSGITLVGVPADVYTYGASFWLMCLSIVLLAFLTIYVYMPVFFNLHLTSTHSYLERRFDKKNRLLASFLYFLCTDFYLSLIAYNAAVTFSTATATNVHLVSVILCSTCIFYTTIGGLRTVVWTDILQYLVILGSLLSVFLISINSFGFQGIWNTAIEGGRLDIFDFDPNPTKRDSFWIILIGYTIQAVGEISIHPTAMQKFMSLPTFSNAIKSIICFVLCLSVVITLCIFIGLGIYTKYAHCDPLIYQKITSYNQLVPYYIMNMSENFPGVFGLYMAAIFSAALSSISSSLNALAGVVFKDFVSKRLKKPISEKSETTILKLIVGINGLICMLLVFLVQYLEGGIFSVSIVLTAITNGALTGMFTLGVLFPKANSTGAFYGAICGLVSIAAIAVPAQYYQSKKLFEYPRKNLATDQCNVLNMTFLSYSNHTFFENITNFTFNTTFVNEKLIKNDSELVEPFFLFRISFYYYTLIGALVTIVMGLIISFSTNRNEIYVEKILISPVTQFLLPKNENAQHDNVKTTTQPLMINDNL